MGRPTKKPEQAIVASTRALMDGNRPPAPMAPLATQSRELSPAELLATPTITLGKILSTLDLFVSELYKRAKEQSMTLKDVRALTDIVKAHSSLRQTQLAEDAFARQAQSVATDTDVALLLIEAVKAGGPDAVGMLREALATIDALAAAPGAPAELSQAALDDASGSQQSHDPFAPDEPEP